MKALLILFSLTIIFSAQAQTVEMIAKSDYVPNKMKQKDFYFLSEDIDTTKINYIASYKAEIRNKKSDITTNFFTIKNLANKIGANSFLIKSFTHDSTEVNTFILDVFYVEDAMVKINSDILPKNKVYIFCSEKNTDEIYSLKVNNLKTEFKSGSYLEYELSEGQELKLSKGGFTGATVLVKYQPEKPSAFFSITGFGLGGDTAPMPGAVGVSFNTGRINYVDRALGFLLTKMLQSAQ